MRIVCWQMILVKYNYLSVIFFFRKLGKMLQNLSSAAVVIGPLRVKAMISSRTVPVKYLCKL